MAAGLPGRFTMRHAPRCPAVCRDRMAVGTLRSDAVRMASPNPGSMRSHTASVASGVGYTAGRRALAYIGAAEIFVLAFFGVIACAGTHFAHTGQVSGVAAWVGAELGAIAAGILAVNNLRDREQDARVAKRTLAVRFGAKEATMKALGAGLGAFAFREVEVVRDDDSGAPSLALHGAAAALAATRGVHAWQVSLTHTDTTAMAVVIALG